MFLKLGAEARHCLRAGQGDGHRETELGALPTGSYYLRQGGSRELPGVSSIMHPAPTMQCLGWERWAGLGRTSRQAGEDS